MGASTDHHPLALCSLVALIVALAGQTVFRGCVLGTEGQVRAVSAQPPLPVQGTIVTGWTEAALPTFLDTAI